MSVLFLSMTVSYLNEVFNEQKVNSWFLVQEFSLLALEYP